MVNIKPIIGFMAGLLTGSVVTYIFTKSSLKAKHNKELNEIRAESLDCAMEIVKNREDVIKSSDILKRTEEGNIKNEEPKQAPVDIPSNGFKERDVEEYTDYAKQYAPQSGANVQVINPGKPSESVDKKPVKPPKAISPTDDHPMSMVPYAIDPDDFGEMDGYDTVYLTYFADGILAYDDTNDTIEQYDLDTTVGTDFKSGFGEYSDTTVWVRNNKTMIDYQIEKSHDYYYGAD